MCQPLGSALLVFEVLGMAENKSDQLGVLTGKQVHNNILVYIWVLNNIVNRTGTMSQFYYYLGPPMGVNFSFKRVVISMYSHIASLTIWFPGFLLILSF